MYVRMTRKFTAALPPRALRVAQVGTRPRRKYHARDSEANACGFLSEPAVRHDRISSLQAKNSLCSEDEWKAILTSILLEHEPAKEDVEAVASVEPENKISVKVQKRIQGITVGA